MTPDPTKEQQAPPHEITLDELDQVKSELYALKIKTAMRDRADSERRLQEGKAAMDEHVRAMSEKYGVDMNQYTPQGNKAVLAGPMGRPMGPRPVAPPRPDQSEEQ